MLASDFAATPAGYISGIIVPTLLVGCFMLLGFLGKRGFQQADERREQDRAANEKRLSAIEVNLGSQGQALTTNTQALAILVERLAPMQSQLANVSVKTNDLDKALAVLQHAMDRHEKWAANERAEIQRKLGT